MLHVKIMVQRKNQPGESFGDDIERRVLFEVKAVSETKGLILDGRPEVTTTSDQNGRLTAVLQYRTKECVYDKYQV